MPWCPRHATRALKLSRLQIMDLVPSASAVVLQVVLQRLPHKRFEKETHQHFLHSVFRIAESSQGGPIRDGLLLGVIDRLLEVRLCSLKTGTLVVPIDTPTLAQGRCGNQV